MIGAKRLLEEVSDADCVCHAEYLPEKNRRVPSKASAVLQDRDCTFRGCRILQRAKKLEEVLNGSEERYEIQRIPGISSVVYFAAALHTSWEDAALVSSMEDGRTGFMKQNIMQKLFCCWAEEKKNLKEKLLYYGLEDLTVHIGKNFSYPQEQIFQKR